MDRGETFGLTPWHLMERYDGTRGSERHGITSERHWVGWYLVPDCDYRIWKRDPYGGPADLIGGRVWLRERGEWSPFQCDIEACDLETTHRVVAEPPEEPIRNFERWLESLRLDDTDRFVMHYAGLESASWEFFEYALRRDPPTVRCLEVLDAFVDGLGGKARVELEGWDDLVETAYHAAMFHRAVESGCTVGSHVVTGPEAIPGPLPYGILQALQGHGTYSSMLRHCESAEAQFAASLLSIVRRWDGGRAPHAWTIDLVHRILDLPAEAIDWDEIRLATRETP